jgi:hypothetical protein
MASTVAGEEAMIILGKSKDDEGTQLEKLVVAILKKQMSSRTKSAPGVKN